MSAIELTEQQQQTLDAVRGTPPRVVDPRTKETYILLRADVYERLKPLLSDTGDLDPRETYPMLDSVFGEDWNDPKMAEYDRYEDHKK